MFHIRRERRLKNSEVQPLLSAQIFDSPVCLSTKEKYDKSRWLPRVRGSEEITSDTVIDEQSIIIHFANWCSRILALARHSYMFVEGT